MFWAVGMTQEESSATRISEIVAHTLSYLPSSDLLSCTRVNRLWGTEARKHLLKHPSTALCCRNVSPYFDSMYSSCHATLDLTLCTNEACFPTLAERLREKGVLSRVTSLTTSWALDRAWGKDFHLWATSLPNLTTLSLTPHLASWVRIGPNLDLWVVAATQLSHLPQGFTWPSVTTLIWNQNNGRQLLRALREPNPTTPAVLAMFPALTSFHFRNVGSTLFRTLMKGAESGFPKLDSISYITNSELGLDPGFPIYLKFLPLLHLTSLDFNLGSCRFSHVSELGWDEMLTLLAATLVHLTITWAKVIFSDELPGRNKCRTMVIPVLPRLYSFRVVLAPTRLQLQPGSRVEVKKDSQHGGNGRRAEFELQFVTATPEGGCQIRYGTQFPSLRRLEVGVGGGGGMAGRESQVDEDAFENCIQFLTTSFLPPAAAAAAAAAAPPVQLQGPCESLRLLIFPTPPRSWGGNRKWKRVPGPASQFGERDIVLVSRAGRGAQYLERIAETFPNILNLGRYKYGLEEEGNAYEERMAEWLQLGEKFGLIEK